MRPLGAGFGRLNAPAAKIHEHYATVHLSAFAVDPSNTYFQRLTHSSLAREFFANIG